MNSTTSHRSSSGWRALTALAICALITVVNGQGWTQYRGPNHDGISTESIRINWAQQAPRLLWKVRLDPALSSFSVSGGRAFTQARRRAGSVDREFCIALDANTGAELWAVPVGIADYPDGGVGSDDGPRSTPTVDGDRLYVFGSYLRLLCLEAATGREIWSRDFVAESGSSVVAWQNAASPVIAGDLVFVNGNATGETLVALRKHDGTVAWKGQNDRMTQATPVVATLAGVPQVIFFARSGLVSVAPASGEVLWRYPFSFRTSTAASPVVANDLVYCSAAYGVGAGAVQVSGSGGTLTAREIWKTPGANMNHWATPVHHDGHLYGIYGQSLLSLRCVDLATGVEKWRQGGVGYGSVLFVSGHVLVLTDTGEVTLVKPDPSAYAEVARFKAVTGKCWNTPAISDGRLYVRSTTEAAAYEIAAAVAPKPKLYLGTGLAAGNGAFQLFISNQDGSTLTADRGSTIDILTSTDPALGWTKLTVSPELLNGQLRFEDSQSGSTPQRFFRTQEKP